MAMPQQFCYKYVGDFEVPMQVGIPTGLSYGYYLHHELKHKITSLPFFKDGENYCQGFSSDCHLTSITSYDEMNIMTDLTYDESWIGIRQFKNTSENQWEDFYWVDGSPISYNYYLPPWKSGKLKDTFTARN